MVVTGALFFLSGWECCLVLLRLTIRRVRFFLYLLLEGDRVDTRHLNTGFLLVVVGDHFCGCSVTLPLLCKDLRCSVQVINVGEFRVTNFRFKHGANDL